jgi:predicted MFS family arabinose efflux permease
MGPTNPNVLARRAVWAAYVGFFVDMFEVYLPIAVLAPALVYFIPGGLNSATRATLFYMVFAASLVSRPVGAVIFGHIGDRLGRRRTILISVGGFGLTTLLIAALPGHALWGDYAIAAMILLRVLDGIFIGGEYTAANPLAMEYAPKDKRGLYAGLIHIGYPAALVCISLLTALMLKVAPAGGPDSPYALWGWRSPFVIGALLAGGLFAYCYFQVPESEVWHASTKSAAPVKDLFSGDDLRRLAQLFIVMNGAWLTLNSTIGALPGVINTILGANSADVNTGVMIGAAIAIPLLPLVGVVSQRTGRRPAIVVFGVLSLLPASSLYYLLVSGAYRNPTSMIGLVAAIVALTIPMWAILTPYLAESFRTAIRSCGYGIAYSLAALLPGLYSFYMLGLAKWMPYEFSPVALLALGGFLLIVGALAGPETKHADFRLEPAPAVAG